MPGPKNGERPYLAVPKPTFWDPILGLFFSDFYPDHDVCPSPTHATHLFSFLFLYTQQQQIL